MVYCTRRLVLTRDTCGVAISVRSSVAACGARYRRRNGMRRSQHRLGERGHHGHVGRRVAFAPPQSNQKKSVTMSDLEERPTLVGVKRTLTGWNQELQRIRSPILSYGLCVFVVT